MKIDTMTKRTDGEQCDRCKRPVTNAVEVDGKNFHAFCADRKIKDDMIEAQKGESNE